VDIRLMPGSYHAEYAPDDVTHGLCLRRAAADLHVRVLRTGPRRHRPIDRKIRRDPF
jgi:hypothetical protein